MSMSGYKPGLCAVLVASLAACAVQPSAPAPTWAQHLQQFQEEYFVLNPAFAVGQGRHEFDGKLPDWSKAGLARQVQWLQSERSKTAAFGAASAQQRFEREYLLAQIDADLFWLVDAERPWRAPAFYLGSLDPGVYLTRPYAAPAVRLKAFIAHLNALPAATAHMQANLRRPLPRTFVNHAMKNFEGYAVFFRDDARKAFASVDDDALQAELEAALKTAVSTMQNLADGFKRELPTATEDFALGAQKFSAMLRSTERVTTPLAQLEAIGKADLQRNLTALKQACAQYLPKGNTEACIAKMSSDKPSGGPVEGARAQLADLRQFVVDQKLVSIPGTELALVDTAPPYQAQNSAYIDIPGPYDKGMPSIYYIAPPDPSWSEADRNAYLPGKADLLATSVHEVWPGHFLQFLHANRSSFAFGRSFIGYAFAEGWAHYTEEMMWEAGLGNGDPAIQIGQISNALLRNVRFLCAIGLHTQGMSVQTCETMFREQAYQDPGNARQQAARGTYDPAYLNYTLGKLMIRKLRADWTATRGGRAAWLAFHDQLLSYGGPPLPLVREQMMGSADGPLF